MKPAIEIIKHFEGCHLTAYLCPAKVWTIGYGSTIHPNGQRVRQGDRITQQQAEDYLLIEINRRLAAMNLPPQITINRRAALVSFVYNLGLGAWNRSTLRRKVLLNQSDPTIRDEFMKWNKAGGRVLKGLTRRRKAEADLYFKSS
jgi:lysozyme